MNDDQRLKEIRRRVRRYRSMTIDAKIAAPGFAFGCMADESFLLALLDACLRDRAHFAATPAPLPVIPEPTPRTTVASVQGYDVRFEDGWGSAIAAAGRQAEAAAVAGLREGLNPYQIRAKVAEAIAALEHRPSGPKAAAAPPPMTSAPAVQPPAEPPPFTI